MAKYRDHLPQLADDVFLTDGGLETTLIFHQGVDLPEFAAFVLLDDDTGMERLRQYFRRYMDIAREANAGFIAEAVTWRANPDWASKLGYDAGARADVNRRAIAMLSEMRAGFEDGTGRPFVISGCLGPRDDGYNPSTLMTPEEAQRYHTEQIATFAATDADMVSALTMTHTGEAIGIVEAAKAEGIPAVISFTVETDGKLPSGTTLDEAITDVDRATGAGPAYYMINCAHPTHFQSVLDAAAPWVSRVRALRANASRMSHAELDAAEELDAGNPDELGEEYRQLRDRLGQLTILGGCCGTDDRHVAAVARACLRP